MKDDRSDDFTDDTSEDDLLFDETSVVENVLSRRIGPYRILRPLGQGGMGIVFLAERDDFDHRQQLADDTASRGSESKSFKHLGSKRQVSEANQRPTQVALKLIQPGYDSKATLARFDAERVALALMDHENIARVIDSGTSEDGMPYLAMEMIHGVPITKYCNKHQLKIEDRLELFESVCRAIHHAHQKGIIHRDIKPANILVAVRDSQPVAKVIDFGLAKSLKGRLTEKTIVSDFQAIGTYSYMSPEQTENAIYEVDSRSDIYSLGILLYELLCGSTPITNEVLRQESLDQILRMIRENDPPRPSIRLRETVDEQKNTKPNAEIRRLSRSLEGDLDWIAMKALEKDKNRRYDSASAFADDIDRFLANEPVYARPPNGIYRLRKLYKKHRGIFATAAALLLMLLFGTGMVFWHLLRIQTESERYRAATYRTGMQVSHFDWIQGDTLNVIRELERHFPGAGQKDLRQFEWYLLWKVHQRRILTPTIKTNEPIIDVGYAPDGKSITTISILRTSIWNPKTRKLISSIEHEKLLRGPNGQLEISRIGRTGVSDDGRLTVIGHDDGNLTIIDNKSKTLRKLNGEKNDFRHFLFSPSRSYLAIGYYSGRILAWDLTTGKRLPDIKGHKDRVYGLAFSPDEKTLISGSRDKRVRLWDIKTGKQRLRDLETAGNSAWCVACSPDGKLIAAGTSGNTRVYLWNAESGELIRELRGHLGMVSSVKFSPDGSRIASASTDKAIRIWDVQSGRLQDTLRCLNDHDNIAFSHDGGILASCSKSGDLLIWDLSVAPAPLVLRSHSDNVTVGTFSPDGKMFATGSFDRTIDVWDVASGQHVHQLKGHQAKVFDVNFSPDGKYIAATGGDNVVMLWNAHNGNLLRTIPAPASSVGQRNAYAHVEFRPNSSQFAVLYHAGSVAIFDLKNDRELPCPAIEQSVFCTSIAYSHDGEQLFLATSHVAETYRLLSWNVREQEFQQSIELGEYRYGSMAVSPDGLVALGSAQTGSVTVVDPIKKKTLWRTTNGSTVFSVDFTPDGRVISGGERLVHFQDARDGERLFQLDPRSEAVNGVTMSPDGKVLATVSSDNTAKLWRKATDEEIAELRRVFAAED